MISRRRLFYICERVNAEILGVSNSPFAKEASNLNKEETEKYNNMIAEMVKENEKFKKRCEELGVEYKPILIPPIELDWGE